MYEAEPEDDDEDWPSAIFARVGDDGGLLGDWLDTAESLARNEQGLGRWWFHPSSSRSFMHDGGDHHKPDLVIFGSREALAFIGDIAAGIAEHGPAFAAWARLVGLDRERLSQFEESFLGTWQSPEQLVSEVLSELGPVVAEGRADQQLRVLTDPADLAEELQRRGDITALENPHGGVWIFRRS
jgi:hypothetical protein